MISFMKVPPINSAAFFPPLPVSAIISMFSVLYFSKISVNGRDDNTTLGASHKSNSKKVGSLEMPDANDPRFEDV